MKLTISRSEQRTEDGFVYHELVFYFSTGRRTTRFVSDDVWRARHSDARSAWDIWHKVKADEFKEPPVQGKLL